MTDISHFSTALFYFLHFDFIPNWEAPRLIKDFIIMGLPQFIGGFILITIGVSFTAYRLYEPFKPWKHSCIIGDNFIYYYGNLFDLKHPSAPLSSTSWNVLSIELKERTFRGKVIHLLHLDLVRAGGKRNHHFHLNIYVPPSLREQSKFWYDRLLMSFSTVIQPVYYQVVNQV